MSAVAGWSAATGAVGAVGMAGLTLGGGYGPLCGVAGLAADNLLGAEVVLADGSIVTADEDSRPDLLWALRGGGGNFGVVTAMRLRLHPVPVVYAGSVMFPIAQARDVLAGFGELIATAPDELTAQSGVISTADGTPVLFVNPPWSGADDEGARWVRQIENLGRPVMSNVASVPYGRPLSRGDQMFAPDGRHYAMRTRNLGGLTPEAVAAILTAAQARTSPLSAISIHHFHGAATRVAPTGNGDDAAHRRWADDAAELLRPHALPGGYPNLLTAEHHEQTAHAYGPNAERLTALKRTYDSDGVFTATPLP